MRDLSQSQKRGSRSRKKKENLLQGEKSYGYQQRKGGGGESKGGLYEEKMKEGGGDCCMVKKRKIRTEYMGRKHCHPENLHRRGTAFP